MGKKIIYANMSDDLSSSISQTEQHISKPQTLLGWFYHIWQDEMIVLPCLPLRHISTGCDNCRSKQTQQGPEQRKVTEGCSSSCPHLQIDHTLLSAIWPLNIQEESCRHATEIYFMIFRNVSLFFRWACCWGPCEGCVSNLNAEQETSAWSQEDSSLCHFPSSAASSPALLLAEWEGGGEKKLKNNKY